MINITRPRKGSRGWKKSRQIMRWKHYKKRVRRVKRARKARRGK